MEISKLFISNMYGGQFDFSICIIFCIIMFFFMFLSSLLYLRKRWTWMWHISDCWKSTKKKHAEDVLKNRLAIGEINEIEYDNLLKKIKD